MNIFVLDEDPVLAARWLCDKHVVKMVLESAQILCAPFEPGTAPYKRTHYNHRCVVWARRSSKNYWWLLEHAFALAAEYTFRYQKRHKSESVIEWCHDRFDELRFAYSLLTPFAQAVPAHHRRKCAVQAYRTYYLGDKAYMAQWNRGRPAPPWWSR